MFPRFQRYFSRGKPYLEKNILRLQALQGVETFGSYCVLPAYLRGHYTHNIHIGVLHNKGQVYDNTTTGL